MTLIVAVVRQDNQLVRLLRQWPTVEVPADLPAREAGDAQQQGRLLLVHPADLDLRTVPGGIIEDRSKARSEDAVGTESQNPFILPYRPRDRWSAIPTSFLSSP